MGWDVPPRENWSLVENGEINTDDLKLWIKKMSHWAARVRKDILKLEEAGKVKKGDPGDPPPPPE